MRVSRQNWLLILTIAAYKRTVSLGRLIDWILLDMSHARNVAFDF